MNDTNENILKSTFPSIFRELPYIECGDGWFKIIYDTCQRIAEIDPTGAIKADQIKEKFGGGRFYFSMDKSGTKETFEQVSKLVAEFEDLSYKTCESCGTTENVSATTGGWILTLCESCKGKREQKRAEQTPPADDSQAE